MLKRNVKSAWNRGFTLLELIVVLLVLGILAAIAIPTYQQVQANALKGSAQTSAEAVYRDAQAIAAFAPGGAVDEADLETALGEAGLTDTSSAADGKVTFAMTSGNNTATADVTTGGGITVTLS